MSRYLLLVIITLLSALFANGQNSPKVKKKKFLSDNGDDIIWQKAEVLFEDGNFQLALPKYQKLEEKYPGEPVLQLRLGVIYLNQPENVGKSLEYLSKLEAKKFLKTDLALFLGKAYHANLDPDRALVELNTYLLRNNTTPANKLEAREYVIYCENLREMMKNPVDVKIKNMGMPVNSENSEYVPVISSDESVMFFTYRGIVSTGGLQSLPGKPDPNGQYFEDIMVSEKEAGKWTTPKLMSANINTNAHDACIALSNDGQKLFIFKNLPNDVGAIFMSKLDSNRWSAPVELKGGISSTSWEGSVSLSADERTLYFSSERPGGFGGKDIYTANLIGDTAWGNVKNLGPGINTAKDDDAPFIHPSGAFLIFSSKGHTSIGGFDIFRTDLENDTAYSPPINLGYPINTPGDDIYYVLSADGKRGYYSSGKAGGNGMQDIYVSEPGLVGKRVILALVKGLISLNDKPVAAQVSVININTGNTVAVYNSNAVSGKYLFNVPAGKNYKFIYHLPLFDPIEKSLNTMEIDSFMEPTMDIPFYTPEYLAAKKARQDSIDQALAVAKALLEGASKLDVIDTDIMAKYGKIKIPGLTFTVQIGAFNMESNFKYTSVAKFGKVKKIKGEDNITRFTIGSSLTLNDAFTLKGKIITAGIKDAFVTGIYNGKRYLLKEMIANKVFEPIK